MRPLPSLFAKTPLQIEPSPAEPRLWVKRLVLQSEPGVLLREVPLERGMNVVWSPDPADPGGRPATNALGHGAGKTLFCRMLRYCLGEPRFAPEGQRDDIMGAFPEGLVGAEVVVDGRTWSVARPIGLRRRHVALPDADLDAVMRGEGPATGIDAFVRAIGEQIITDPIASLIPQRGNDGLEPMPPLAHAWLTALAWLTRDQECRFNHALDWRATSSNSDSPARSFSGADSLLAVRALIGALGPEETRVRTRISTLEKELATANDDAQHWAWNARQLRAELVRALALREEELPPDRLAVEVLRRTIQERAAHVPGMAANDGDGNDLPALRERLDEAERRRRELARKHDRLVDQAPLKAKEVSRLRAEAEVAGVRVDDAKSPVCEVCEVPIDRVLVEGGGCKFSHETFNLEKLLKRQRDAKEGYERFQRQLDNDAHEERAVAKDLEVVSSDAKNLRKLVRSLEATRDAHANEWANAQRLLDDVTRLEGALLEHEGATARTAGLREQLATRRESVAELRGAQAGIFSRLVQRFGEIVPRLVSTDAEGRLRLTGRGLELGVSMGGNRSTAAIESLKVLAFDLATLVLAMEGRIHVPAFLMHDSPREADLGQSAYDQLFALARALEAFGPSPAFQYIVTTTTAPPKYIKPGQGLALTLHGAPASERLLRRDL